MRGTRMTSESDCKDLFLAAQSNNVACLEAILTSGGCANSNEIAKVEGSEKHLVPVRGWTPLHVAAYHGHTEAIDTLIKSGANVNASDQFRHENDLIWQMLAKNNAALAHQVFDEVEKVKSLRQRHFQSNVTFVGNLYSTPLHYAAMQGQFEVVKKLLEWGSDPTVRNVNGQTPKDVATDYRVKSLLEQKQNLLETPIMTKYVFG